MIKIFIIYNCIIYIDDIMILLIMIVYCYKNNNYVYVFYLEIFENDFIIFIISSVYFRIRLIIK